LTDRRANEKSFAFGNEKDRRRTVFGFLQNAENLFFGLGGFFGFHHGFFAFDVGLAAFFVFVFVVLFAHKCLYFVRRLRFR
jgi:hypothetical protein